MLRQFFRRALARLTRSVAGTLSPSTSNGNATGDAPAGGGAKQVDSDVLSLCYGDTEVRFAATGGVVERNVRANRFYEGELLRYIEALALRGAYVDAGAFVGTHSVFFALFCPATVVHAFEPRRTCHELLVKNLSLNDLASRVKTHELGLSDVQEDVTVTLNKRSVTFACVPLDEVVSEPVCAIKIDVEGMEPKVLAGAKRILASDGPLIFVEAHSEEELARSLEPLAPLGYRPTGRVFNASPTYELASDTSRTAPTSSLPISIDLLERSLWQSPVREMRWNNDSLRLELSDGEALAVSHDAAPWTSPPTCDALRVEPHRAVFLQVTGEKDPGVKATVHVVQYAGDRKLSEGTVGFRARIFHELKLDRRTDRLRFGIRARGSGSLSLTRAALHVLRPS